MLRKIVTIDESLCDGCGDCVTSCSEGALQIVDGIAKLVKEDFCDGFGDCIGHCPTGALVVETREAEPFDEEATIEYLMESQGKEAVDRMVESQKRHNENHEAAKPAVHACPGSAMREFKEDSPSPKAAGGPMSVVNQPELRQWPIQIHLVPPGAPFFRNKELVIMNTCGPLASADVHWRYLRGRSVVVGCPKLDNTQPYPQKLGSILSDPTIPKIIVVRMEVPCCGGLTMIAEEAVRLSGRTDIEFQEDTIHIDGSITSKVIRSKEENAMRKSAV